MIKVSIIIPIYNAASTIEKCVDSILNQDYNNYEVLLINDGSVDKSFEIIQKYKKNKKVKMLNQTNHGVAYTRNRGINESKGKYIMFIDNDEFIDYNYVKSHVEVAEKEDADVVISGYRRINAENMIMHEEKLKNTYWSRYIIVAPWAKIYKKEFLVKNNIEFLSYNIGEDVYFNLSVYSYNPKISIIDYVGYNWFFNTKSVSNTSQRGLDKKIDILFLLNKIIEKYKFLDEYLSYYLIRYYIWYLLFSGRKAKREDFLLEYNKIKAWYNKNNICLKIKPWSKKLAGESFKNRLIVFLFINLEKLHLVKIFSALYCKDKK